MGLKIVDWSDKEAMFIRSSCIKCTKPIKTGQNVVVVTSMLSGDSNLHQCAIHSRCWTRFSDDVHAVLGTQVEPKKVEDSISSLELIANGA